jgi:hypothetical protein
MMDDDARFKLMRGKSSDMVFEIRRAKRELLHDCCRELLSLWGQKGTQREHEEAIGWCVDLLRKKYKRLDDLEARP